METKDLARAYKELLAAAESITEDGLLSEADWTQVDWVLAHIALSDRALAGAAREVLNQRPGRIDNAPAMSKSAIADVLASTTHTERVEMVRRNSAELMDLLKRTPQERAATMVRAVLVGRTGELLLDDNLEWGAVVKMRTHEHIPGHAAKLAAMVQQPLE